MIPDDPRHRRALLATTPNPAARLDYLCRLDGRLDGAVTAVVTLRYVPDRRVLSPAAFAAYLAALAETAWPSLEAAAAALLDDAADVLVPRWIELTAAALGDAPGHVVVIGDRQPRWDNRPLLDRLGRPPV